MPSDIIVKMKTTLLFKCLPVSSKALRYYCEDEDYFIIQMSSSVLQSSPILLWSWRLLFYTEVLGYIVEGANEKNKC